MNDQAYQSTIALRVLADYSRDRETMSLHTVADFFEEKYRTPPQQHQNGAPVFGFVFPDESAVMVVRTPTTLVITDVPAPVSFQVMSAVAEFLDENPEEFDQWSPRKVGAFLDRAIHIAMALGHVVEALADDAPPVTPLN